ncbi:hypothetical protein BpHYR1_016187, partial [Brachionus plicatilis]
YLILYIVIESYNIYNYNSYIEVLLLVVVVGRLPLIVVGSGWKLVVLLLEVAGRKLFSGI